MISLFEFTTGARHPLSSVHTIFLPISSCEYSKPEFEVFGDYILVTSMNGEHSELFVVSWKTGTTKRVSGTVESFQCRPNFEPSSIALSHFRSAEGCSHRPGQQPDRPYKGRYELSPY